MDEVRNQLELTNEISDAISNPAGMGIDVSRLPPHPFSSHWPPTADASVRDALRRSTTTSSRTSWPSWSRKSSTSGWPGPTRSRYTCPRPRSRRRRQRRPPRRSRRTRRRQSSALSRRSWPCRPGYSLDECVCCVWSEAGAPETCWRCGLVARASAEEAGSGRSAEEGRELYLCSGGSDPRSFVYSVLLLVWSARAQSDCWLL